MIEMPNLEGLGFRSAVMKIRQYGLKLGDTVYQPFVARDYVMQQQVNGSRIKAGMQVSMGTGIVLVLGSGAGEDEFDVPDLSGKTLAEAREQLESYGLVVGAIIPQNLRNDPGSYVKEQNPSVYTADSQHNKIRKGQLVDLFLQN